MRRLWMVTGLLTNHRENLIVGSIFEATSSAEAVGLLLAREQQQYPKHAAMAFKATDCTDVARDFAARSER